MPIYVIELFKDDGTILARSDARDVPRMDRSELREWAQKGVPKV